MAKFLNTQGLSEWMGRIIDETEREIVIISPYLQISDNLFQKLLNADKKGVEVIFIYRTLDKEKYLRINTSGNFERTKNNLDYQLEKLKAIENLNLMHHPNVHAKCMYNENYFLTSSMNFYEYSEKNNREIGVLFHKKHIPEFSHDEWGDNSDYDSIFEDALEEIIEIKNAAEMERPSRETMEDGFELEILKNSKEKKEEFLKLVNKAFLHKKFILDTEDKFLCKSYIDKVDVLWDYRIEFNLKLDEKKLNNQFDKSRQIHKELEFSISGFKMYWNRPNCIYLYDDSRHEFWKKVNSDLDEIQLRKKGIDEMISFIKEFKI